MADIVAVLLIIAVPLIIAIMFSNEKLDKDE